MANGGTAQANVQELALPVLPAGSVEVYNAFYRRRAPLPIFFGGHRVIVEPAWTAAEAPAGYTVQIEIDGERAELRIPRQLVELALAELDAAPALDGLPPAHAAMVLEYALTEPLQLLESQLGSSIFISSVFPNGRLPRDPARLPLSFSLTLDGAAPAASELSISPAQAMRLAQYLDRSAGWNAANLNLPFVMSLRVASVTLTAAEIASLQAGDVVLTDENCQPGTAVLVIANHLGAPAVMTQEGIRLADTAGGLRGSAWEWAVGEDTLSFNRDAVEAAPMNAISMRLMFDLGCAELNSRQLGELGRGSLLPFMLPASGEVDIVTAGRRIGKGVLLNAGTALGVRVTRMFAGR
jgi:type III secretion system YscQ/HrcQ family protein